MDDDLGAVDTPSPSEQHAASAINAGDAVPPPPAFNGLIVENQESGQSPLVALLTQLYARDDRVIGARAGALCGDGASTNEPVKLPTLPVFTFDHDCAILREPFESSAFKGLTTRPCLMGDSCMGMHKALPGHRASGGVVLTEVRGLAPP